MKKRFYIFDTTLRDGEQAPGFSMNLDEKVRLAAQLELLGVDVIEAGFPISSDGDFQAAQQISKNITKCTVAGLARARKGDIDRAWEALKYAKKPRIHTFIATSDIHMEFKLKKTRKEVLQDAVQAVEYARSLCPEVEFSAEDATRTDVDFLCEIVEATIGAGARIINIPDTVGYAMPWEFGDLIKTLRDRVPNIDKAILSVHCHNDLGLAVANSLMAIRNGAQQIECTINGIGERAGNASLEEIVMAVHTRSPEFKQESRIKTSEIYPTSKMLSEITRMQVQVNKAVVGQNAFSHEAGIHQDGVLKNPLTYEIMTPNSVGLTSNNIVLGKHSGRRALHARLKDLGFDLSKDEMDKAYEAFIAVADKKKVVVDEDLISIVSGSSDKPTVGGGGGEGLNSTFIKETMQEYLNRP